MRARAALDAVTVVGGIGPTRSLRAVPARRGFAACTPSLAGIQLRCQISMPPLSPHVPTSYGRSSGCAATGHALCEDHTRRTPRRLPLRPAGQPGRYAVAGMTSVCGTLGAVYWAAGGHAFAGRLGRA